MEEVKNTFVPFQVSSLSPPPVLRYYFSSKFFASTAISDQAVNLFHPILLLVIPPTKFDSFFTSLMSLALLSIFFFQSIFSSTGISTNGHFLWQFFFFLFHFFGMSKLLKPQSTKNKSFFFNPYLTTN